MRTRVERLKNKFFRGYLLFMKKYISPSLEVLIMKVIDVLGESLSDKNIDDAYDFWA